MDLSYDLDPERKKELDPAKDPLSLMDPSKWIHPNGSIQRSSKDPIQMQSLSVFKYCKTFLGHDSFFKDFYCKFFLLPFEFTYRLSLPNSFILTFKTTFQKQKIVVESDLLF